MRPGIKPRSPGPLANTLPTRPMSWWTDLHETYVTANIGCLNLHGIHVTANIGCLNIYGTYVTANNATSDYVVFFFCFRFENSIL